MMFRFLSQMTITYDPSSTFVSPKATQFNWMVNKYALTINCSLIIYGSIAISIGFVIIKIGRILHQHALALANR